MIADLNEEREFLAELAYPELNKFCDNYGLTCHVVDLRQGRNCLDNSRETIDIIRREIEKCQDRSIGPSFVVSAQVLQCCFRVCVYLYCFIRHYTFSNVGEYLVYLYLVDNNTHNSM